MRMCNLPFTPNPAVLRRMSWLRRLLGLKSRVRVVGSDLNGNQYMETQTGGSRRPRRTVKMVDVSTDQYTEDSLPHEWEQWLRGTRQEPPTHKELLQRLKQSEVMKVKIAEALDRDTRLRVDEDGHETQRVKAEEHASAPSFKSDQATSAEPTSTGKDFRPGSWRP